MARKPTPDPYVYPGTETLRNRFGLTDPAMLRIAEYVLTQQRALNAPAFSLTPEGFKATHRHLFADVFAWAGQTRTVDLRHPREQSPFALPHLVEGALASQFRSLAADNHLAKLDAPTFADKAAHHIGELNAIHAFREGNGRAMRLHLLQLAARAGHEVNLSRIAVQAWNDASRISFNTADPRPLAAVIAGAMGPRGRLDAEIAQAQVALSPDARLVYAAMAEKIGRQMVRLSPSEVAELRADVARGLVAKERTEGPVTLTAEQPRLAGTPDGPEKKPSEDTAPTPPRPQRRRR